MAISVEARTVIKSDMDATGFVRGAQQMERAADQAATATQRINTATEKTRRTLNESGGAFERLRKSLDDAYRAQQEYERAQKTLNAGLERGKITQEQYNQLLEVTKQRFENTGASMDRLRAKYDQQFSAQQKLKQSMQEIATLEKAGALTAAAADRERATATQNYQRSIAAMRGVGPASAEVSRSLKLQAHEWTNLSYQAQDFIVQVGSGQGVFRPLLQQAPQAVGAVGGVGNAFRLLLSPVGLGAAALLAFGGTGAILMARLSDLRQEARSFGVALTANNTTIGTSVAQLQQYTRELERQGVEREKARSAILELARTPNISGQTREQIANLLPDFAAGRGVEMNDALKQLIELATGGREAVFKLQDQIGFMSIRQQESAQRFYEQGRSAEALRVVFDALQERFRGLREQELGPQAVAWNNLRNSWSQFLDSLANSRPIIAAVELLTAALTRLASTAPTAGPSQMDRLGEEITQVQERLDRLRNAMSRMPQSVRASPDTVIPGEVGPGSPLDKERQLTEQLAALDAQRLALMEQQRASAEGTEGSLRRQANITPNAPTATGAPAGPTAEQAEADRQTGIVARLRGEVDALAAAHSRGGNAVAEYRARTAALAEAQRLNLNTGNTAILVEQRLREARLGGANASGADRIRERTQELARETAAGIRLNEAIADGLPGLLRAQAETQALADVDGRRTTSLQAQTQAILDRNAAQEASKGAETVLNLQQEIAAAERLANASGLGAQAEAAATLENNIEQATARMRAYAQITTDPRIAAALTAQADKIDEQKRRLAELNELSRNRRAIVAAEMQNEYTQRELELVGESVAVRERELAILREQQNIRREGGRLDTEEAQRRVQLAAQNAEDNTTLSRRRDLYQELGNFGTQAFDRIGEAITQSFVNGEKASVSFKNVAKAVLSEIIQLALRLAVINPIANWATGSNHATIYDAGRSGTASAAGAAAGGGGLSNISGAMAGQTLLSSYPAFSGYGNGLVSGGVGQVFNPGYQMSIGGYGGSVLNAPVYTTGVQMYGPASAAAPMTPMYTSMTAGQLGLGVAGIAGGAYGIYSGLQTGGAKGYTQAAGGAVGMAGGAAGLAVASGATGAGGMLAGAAGTAVAATAAWAPYVAAALIIASMLMPGPKQSNAAAGANINLSTGVVNLENSGKETGATAGARDQMVTLVKDTTTQLETLLRGAKASGVLGFELGQRDPSRVMLNGNLVGTAGVGNNQALADLIGKAILQSFASSPNLADVERRILDAAGSNVDFAMSLLSQTKDLVTTFGSDALNPDRNPATRAIYDAAVQTGSIEAVVAALKGAAELTAAYGEALSTADALQVISKGGGNIQKIADDLKWLFEVYKPLTGAAEQISALDQAIAASNKTYNDAIARATELGLATDVLATKQAEAAEKIRQSLRDSYDAMLAEAQGRSPVTQAVNSAMAIRGNWNANALDYLKVGRDPNELYAAQMTALFKSLDLDTLERVVVAIGDLDPVAKLFAQAALDAAKATAKANAAASYEAQMREATGTGWVTQIIELSNAVAANADAYRNAGKDPAALYAAQVKSIIDGLDADALARGAAELRGLDSVASSFVDAALQAAQAAQDAAAAAERLAAAAQIAADAADYDAKLRAAMGLDLVNTIVQIRTEIDAMAARYTAAGRDPNVLYTAQVNAALAGQDSATLAKTAAGLQSLDTAAASLTKAALEQAIASDVAAAQQAIAAAEAAAAAQAQQDAANAASQAQQDAAQAAQEAASAQQQAANEAAQAAQQLAQAGQNIKNYLTGLKSSPQAGYSPSERLSNATSAYNADLALAQQGNLDALNRITTSADALIQASRDMYGASSQFTTMRDQIIAQLTALPAVQSADQQIIDKLDSIKTATEGTRTNVGTGNSSLSSISSTTSTTNAKLDEAKALLASIDTNNDGIVTIEEIQAAAQAKITAAQSALTTAAQATATNTGATTTAVGSTTTAVNSNTAKADEVKGEVTANNTMTAAIKDINQTLTNAATSNVGGFVALGTLLGNLTRYSAAAAFNTMYSRPASADPGISISSALGNAFADGDVIPFAKGGIPDVVYNRHVAPLAEFGEAGPEGIFPLHRGPDGSLGVRMYGSNDNGEVPALLRELIGEVRGYRRQSAAQAGRADRNATQLRFAFDDVAGPLKRVAAA